MAKINHMHTKFTLHNRAEKPMKSEPKFPFRKSVQMLVDNRMERNVMEMYRQPIYMQAKLWPSEFLIHRKKVVCAQLERYSSTAQVKMFSPMKYAESRRRRNSAETTNNIQCTAGTGTKK